MKTLKLIEFDIIVDMNKKGIATLALMTTSLIILANVLFPDLGLDKYNYVWIIVVFIISYLYLKK